MKVLVLHNLVAADMSASDRDVLVQRDAVLTALELLGHEASAGTCTLNLSRVADQLQEERPDVVFNLVESLSGTDRLAPAVPLLLDALGIPYTGVPTEPLLVSSGKLTGKRALQRAGLPTAPWFAALPAGWQGLGLPAAGRGNASGRSHTATLAPLIIKAVWEHASFCLDDDAIVAPSSDEELDALLTGRLTATRQPHFAEPYVAGREFNLSLLCGEDGPQVLPPAEIDFAAFPAGKPRIVGYRAKWDEDAFEFVHTPRRFDFPHSDTPLLDTLSDLARRCWEHLGLRGYARVDFRVDEQGTPWILEVNANPCLSPDAGFAAALERAGITFASAVDRLLADAVQHSERPSAP
jgi:D-alanine-D-alanine ligase